ncbi:unnamed protein product, partial [Tuber aestivum]
LSPNALPCALSCRHLLYPYTLERQGLESVLRCQDCTALEHEYTEFTNYSTAGTVSSHWTFLLQLTTTYLAVRQWRNYSSQRGNISPLCTWYKYIRPRTRIHHQPKTGIYLTISSFSGLTFPLLLSTEVVPIRYRTVHRSGQCLNLVCRGLSCCSFYYGTVPALSYVPYDYGCGMVWYGTWFSAGNGNRSDGRRRKVLCYDIILELRGCFWGFDLLSVLG